MLYKIGGGSQKRFGLFLEGGGGHLSLALDIERENVWNADFPSSQTINIKLNLKYSYTPIY
jgi:hypothetical protein